MSQQPPLDPTEREHLEHIAHTFVRASRRKGIVTGVVAAVVFMVLQTGAILLGARLTSSSGQQLADRVDRNTAFTACVLTTDPDARTPADVRACLQWANHRFGIDHPPDPRFLSPMPGLEDDGRSDT